MRPEKNFWWINPSMPPYRVVRNRLGWRMFVVIREEVTGGCRKLSDEVLNLYFEPCIIKDDEMKKDEMSEACSTHGSDVKCIQN
jgi:hypothetical protein